MCCHMWYDKWVNKKQKFHEPRVSAANPNVECSLDGLGSVRRSESSQDLPISKQEMECAAVCPIKFEKSETAATDFSCQHELRLCVIVWKNCKKTTEDCGDKNSGTWISKAWNIFTKLDTWTFLERFRDTQGHLFCNHLGIYNRIRIGKGSTETGYVCIAATLQLTRRF